MNFDFGLRPERFTFVALKDFTHHDLGHRHLPATEVTRVYSHTTVINNYTVNNRMVVNRGLPVERVASATHSEIRKVAIRDSPASAGPHTTTRGMEGGTPVVYRPQLQRPANQLNVIAQKVDERHPVIQHSTITAVRNDPARGYALPRSQIGTGSRPVPGSELDRRSNGQGQSAPRTYPQSGSTSPGPGRPREDSAQTPRLDGRGRQ